MISGGRCPGGANALHPHGQPLHPSAPSSSYVVPAASSSFRSHRHRRRPVGQHLAARPTLLARMAITFIDISAAAAQRKRTSIDQFRSRVRSSNVRMPARSLRTQRQFFNLATLFGGGRETQRSGKRHGRGRDGTKGPFGGGQWGSREAASVHVRRRAMTRDARLQLQSHAWTPHNNGEFHSRKRRRRRGLPVGGRRKLLPVGVALQACRFHTLQSSTGCTCIRQAVVVQDASVCVMTDTMNFTNCRYHRLTAKQSLFTLPFTLGYLDIPYFVLFCCLNTAKSALSKR